MYDIVHAMYSRRVCMSESCFSVPDFLSSRTETHLCRGSEMGKRNQKLISLL